MSDRKRFSSRKLIVRTGATLAYGLLFSGLALCAAGQETIDHPHPLQGSWLLAGSPPSGWSSWGMELKGVESGQTFDANDVALAATFSVHGHLVNASYTSMFRCGGGRAADSGVVSGALAADGAFVLRSPSTNGVEPSLSLVILGRVPDAAGSKWEGTYTYKVSTGACVETLSSSFQATQVSIRPGKFVGHATLLLGNDVREGTYMSSSPIDLALEVVSVKDEPVNPGQEGDPGVEWISMRMIVGGYACYRPANQELKFQLHGSTFGGEVPMADGSSIVMNGWIQDVDGRHLYLGLVTKKSGSCMRASSTGLVVRRIE